MRLSCGGRIAAVCESTSSRCKWNSSRAPPARRQVSVRAVVAASTQQQELQQRLVAQDMSTQHSLANIRSALIRQEDTILFNLLERAQFARNEPVYTSDGIPVPGFDRQGRRYSLLEYVLRETEQLHGSVRRYTSPDEHPFYPSELPALALPPLEYPSVLAPCADAININSRILDVYMQDILPAIATAGDDNNYGSAATLDILCLQALSKRIHYGKFVAEAKFRAAPEDYTALIRAQDADGLMARLTDVAVERKVVDRVRLKAATFGQDIVDTAATGESAGNGEGPGARYKVDPDILASMYDNVIMPLTKDVQVAYLLRRLDHERSDGSAGSRT